MLITKIKQHSKMLAMWLAFLLTVVMLFSVFLTSNTIVSANNYIKNRINGEVQTDEVTGYRLFLPLHSRSVYLANNYGGNQAVLASGGFIHLHSYFGNNVVDGAYFYFRFQFNAITNALGNPMVARWYLPVNTRLLNGAHIQTSRRRAEITFTQDAHINIHPNFQQYFSNARPEAFNNVYITILHTNRHYRTGRFIDFSTRLMLHSGDGFFTGMSFRPRHSVVGARVTYESVAEDEQRPDNTTPGTHPDDYPEYLGWLERTLREWHEFFVEFIGIDLPFWAFVGLLTVAMIMSLMVITSLLKRG